MRTNHIKRFLAGALLLAFTASSGITTSMCSASPYTNSTMLFGDVKLSDNNETITLSLRDSDAKQVLRMFADKVGKNIVFHSSVSGKVTLDLVDMPLNEAFNLVLQIAGLNYYTQNNTLIIISKDHGDNAAFSKQEMMVFPVKYVDAGKVATFLNKNVFGMKRAGISGIDAATVNSATNEIIVFGMPSDAAIVEKVIEQLDREPLSKTFVVNHTTPAEMAGLICNLLLPARGSNSGGDSFGGAMTGGAADLSAGGGEGLKLGEGVVACSVSPTAGSTTSAPFEVQNMSVSYFPQRGTVTLMGGSEAQHQMVEKFIKDNDVKQAQAYLEVSIVELNEEGSKQFQNDWNVDSKHWTFSFDANGNTSAQRMAGPRQQFYQTVVPSADKKQLETVYLPAAGVFGNATYVSWKMNYIIRSGKGRVLANPKVIVTNGQESTIDLTQDYVKKVTTEFLSSSQNGSGATGTAQKQYTIGDDLGIKIAITPFISPDGYVTMNVAPDYSTVAREITAPVYDENSGTVSNDLQVTLLSRRNMMLKNVRIKDGETLAIGGLIQEQDTKSVSKIPVLGDLPLIGSLFRTTSTTKSKTELVVLITPKIINDDVAVADSL